MPSSADTSISSTKSASASPVSCSSPPALPSLSRPNSKSKPKQTLTHSQWTSLALSSEAEIKPKSPVTPVSVSKKSQSSAALRQILSHFRAHRLGHRLGEWTKHPLHLERYRELCRNLSDDPELGAYVQDKIRYDYVPHASELIIRMPSRLHDEFTNLVVLEIHRQIKVAIAEFSKSTSSSPLSQFLQNVMGTTTSDVVACDNSRHKRSPNASFCCKGAQFPSLVIETAYSQGAKSLRRVADDWVMMSNGNVKMVIGLEIGYQANKALKMTDKVLVWEPKCTIEEVPVLTSECTFSKPFRNPDGHPSMASNETLIIPVCAFAPKVMLDNHGITKNQYLLPVASIPMRTLACFLDRAQGEFELVQANRGYQDLPPPQVVKRRWSSSSEEDLREEDVRREVHRQAMTAKKVEREDEDWEPSP